MENHASTPSESQQYQQYYLQPEAINPNSYDPTTHAYYASNQPYAPHQPQQQEPRPDYSSYYYPDYSNSYQSLPHADPNSIHPPGVAILAETPQALAQNDSNTYYSHKFVNSQPQNGLTTAPSYSTFTARGGHGDRPTRGGHQNSSRGRGRGRGGRGRVKGTSSVNYIPLGIPRQGPQPSSILGNTFRCEVCRVDCNTPEVLEQHMNGKKHQKNLKVHEELQNAKGQVGLQNPQPEAPDSNVVSGNNNGGVNASFSSATQSLEEREQIEVTRASLKRKEKLGRGGKLMKSIDGSRKPTQSSKPRKAVDLFCSVCSVKCESQAVYNSHMVGKKHLSNIKKFQEHASEVGGSSIVQAFYPPIPNIPSTLQGLYPQTHNVPYSCAPSSQDNQQHLVEPSTSMINNQQAVVQDVQAKLVHILNQHGVQDAHGLLSQMIQVLLTQVQQNEATPNVTKLVTKDHQNSVTHVSSGENEGKLETVGGENIQKIEPNEGVANKSNMGSLEVQDVATKPPTMDATTTSTKQASEN